jgi:hypothetical protein
MLGDVKTFVQTIREIKRTYLLEESALLLDTRHCN